MSYDISITCENPCPHCGGESFNITYNVRPMWEAATGLVSLNDLDGLNIDEAIPHVDRAIDELLHHRDRYVLLETSNGWGTRDHFLLFLRDFRQALARTKFGKVRVT